MTARTSVTGEPGVDDSGPQSDQREILSLLEDSYAREIVTCLREGPKPARTVAAKCDCSRTTVYRRLARLEEAGVVSASVRYDPDGHHRKRFHLCVDKITVELEAGGIVIETGGT